MWLPVRISGIREAQMEFSSFLNYIDPGTGSMLFAIIIGVVTTGVFVVRGLLIKFKFVMHGGRAGRRDLNKAAFVIFSDDKRYWNIFKPVCDEFEKRGIGIEYMTASENDPALSEKYGHVKCEFIGEGNMAFAKLNMMRAGICLSTTPGLDVLQWKRSKDVDWYVHMFHAVDDTTMYRMFGLDHYDAVLMGGEIQREPIRQLEKMRNGAEKELVLAGISYMDSMKERLKREGRHEPSETTVLLAPSWGSSSILNKYGAEFIEKLVKTGYKVIIRPHPQTKKTEPELLDSLMRQFPAGDRLDWNFENDNFNVLNEADILISDFSGIIFDFAFVFDKPVIFADTSYDKAPYDAWWFDCDPWIIRILPEIGRKLLYSDFDNMKEIIDEVISSEEYKAARKKAGDEAWAEQGNSAKNIADYLVKKHEDILKEKPVDSEPSGNSKGAKKLNNIKMKKEKQGNNKGEKNVVENKKSQKGGTTGEK